MHGEKKESNLTRYILFIAHLAVVIYISIYFADEVAKKKTMVMISNNIRKQPNRSFHLYFNKQNLIEYESNRKISVQVIYDVCPIR